MMITMVLGGLWHGAAWTFVFWGALQGLGQSFGHLRRTSRQRRGLPPVADGRRVWVERFLTFQYVCLGWVFFNATGLSQAFAVSGRIVGGWGQASPLVTPLLVFTVLGTLSAQYVPTLSVDRLQAAFSPTAWRRPGRPARVCAACHHDVRSGRRRAVHLLPLLMTDQRTPPHHVEWESEAEFGARAHAELPPPDDGRTRLPWTRVMALGVGAFALWFLLFAPTLQHDAQVSPVGTRRTVSLDITGPVAALSRALQLSHFVSITGRSNRLPGGTVGLTVSGPRPTTTPHAKFGKGYVAQDGSRTDNPDHRTTQPQAADGSQSAAAC